VSEGAAPKPYRPRPLSLLWDWLVLLWVTITSASAAMLFRRLSRRYPVRCEGAQRLPERAGYVLALNHFSDGATGAVVRAVIDAVIEARPTHVERVLMVGGRRERARRSGVARAVATVGAAISRWFRARWSEHFVVISMAGTRADWGALRQWQRRARDRVSVVFPEGIAGFELGAIREGAGRWLATMGVAVHPCAVWFDGERWTVRIGPAVRWARSKRVHDAQLGIAIAQLLPEPLQGAWRSDLERWARLR
jgi:hypothetical protein